MGDNMLAMLMPVIMMMSSDMQSSSRAIITTLVMVLSFILKHISDNGGFKFDTKFFNKKNQSHVIKARLAFKNNLIYDNDISPRYHAIQNKLYTNIIQDSSSRLHYVIDEHKINGEIHKFVCIDTKYEVVPGILISHTTKSDRSELEEFDYVTYTFEITSKSSCMKDILNFIDTCSNEYNEAQVSKHKQQIFSLDGFSKTAYPTYTSIPFHSTKTFDNMFFEQKDSLIDQLDYFDTNYDTYAKLGIPYTMGIMFHGEHGTGKTSCAKAIANYTNRHIILASLSKIKTAKQFENLFLETHMNHLNIPIGKKMFVFDDFDCKGWQDVIKPRTEIDQNAKDSTALDIANTISKALVSMKDEDGNKCNKHPVNDEPITLGDILEILDGFIEMNGRLVVFTTNFIKNIDPALHRFGRIDFTIEFKKLRAADVNNMYQLWFGSPIPLSVLAKIKDYTFSQAELGSIFKKPNVLRALVH